MEKGQNNKKNLTKSEDIFHSTTTFPPIEAIIAGTGVLLQEEILSLHVLPLRGALRQGPTKLMGQNPSPAQPQEVGIEP